MSHYRCPAITTMLNCLSPSPLSAPSGHETDEIRDLWPFKGVGRRYPYWAKCGGVTNIDVTDTADTKLQPYLRQRVKHRTDALSPLRRTATRLHHHFAVTSVACFNDADVAAITGDFRRWQ
jgi:hypothetical protein